MDIFYFVLFKIFSLQGFLSKVRIASSKVGVEHTSTDKGDLKESACLRCLPASIQMCSGADFCLPGKVF